MLLQLLFLGVLLLSPSAADKFINCIPESIKGVRRDVWKRVEISWKDVAIALEKFYSTDSRYPDNPTISDDTIDDLSPPTQFDDAYVQRLRTYLVAPETGNYKFYVSCNRQCEFWLSTDETPNSRQKLLFIESYISFDKWRRVPVDVPLEKHKSYYLEVVHYERAGYDHVKVGMVPPSSAKYCPLPSSAKCCPIPGEFLLKYVSLDHYGAAPIPKWSPWSACAVTCGEGSRTRTRACELASLPVYTSPPPFETTETGSCSGLPPCPVPTSSPSNVSVLIKGSTSLKVNWRPVPLGSLHGKLMGYKVLWNSLDGNFTKETQLNDTLSYLIDGLKEHTKYCVSVLAYTEHGDGMKSTCIFVFTDEDVPSAIPVDIKGQNSSSTSLNVTWQQIPEQHKNGIILSYVVIFRKAVTSQQTPYLQEMIYKAPDCVANESSFSLELKNLEKYTNYCIQVVGVTSKGFGKISDCIYVMTDEDVPSSPPINVRAHNRTSPSSIKVTWQGLAPDVTNGILIGYHVTYMLVTLVGKPVTASTKFSKTVNSSQTETVLDDLLSYSKYCVQVAGVSKKGIGRVSVKKCAETCRCQSTFRVKEIPSGLLPSSDVLQDLVLNTCGTCEAFKRPEFQLSTIQDPDFTFPVARIKGSSTSYSNGGKFLPIINVPGLALVSKRGSSVKHNGFARVVKSIVDSWPIFALSSVMAILAGIIMWILDSSINEKNFPRTFLRGSGEGLWWSYITMTTVGYGDRAPVSFLGKAFAIFWFFVGLVLISLVMGSITAAITITAVIKPTSKDFVTSGSSKVATINGSIGHRIAVRFLKGKLRLATTYETIEELVTALKQDTVEAILVDMYLPSKRKDVFNGKWFVTSLIPKEFSYGAVLKGDTLKLEKDLKNMQIANRAQEKFLFEDKEEVESSEEDQQATKEETIKVFDPRDPMFKQLILVSGSILVAACVLGLIYEVYRLRRNRKASYSAVQNGDQLHKAMMTEMTAEVAEFYSRMRRLKKRLRKKHLKEFIWLTKAKQRFNSLERTREQDGITCSLLHGTRF